MARINYITEININYFQIKLGETWSNQAGSFMATGELWQVAWEEPGRPDGSLGGTWAAALERLVPWVVAAVPVSKEKNNPIYCGQFWRRTPMLSI